MATAPSSDAAGHCARHSPFLHRTGGNGVGRAAEDLGANLHYLAPLDAAGGHQVIDDSDELAPIGSATAKAARPVGFLRHG